MPSFSTRLNLEVPVGADNVSAGPADFSQMFAILDNAVIYLTGTLAARPLASAVVAGTVYNATDQGVYYLASGSGSSGTAWQTMLVAGAWQNLTLGSSIVSFNFTVAARLEGDHVRLCGALENNTGSTVGPGTTLATIPTALRPPYNLNMPCATTSPGGVSLLNIFAGGVINLSATTLNNLGTVTLTGITYRLV